MAPVLYAQDICSASRGVLLTAAALGVEFEVRRNDLFEDDQRSEEFRRINPQLSFPTLVEEDGFTLCDGHAINGYLVNKYGKDDSLYPRDYRTRAIVDQRLHFDTGVLFTRLCVIVRSYMFRNVNKIEQYLKDEIVEAYEFVETFLQGHEYLVGNQLTIADFNAVANVTTLDVLVPIDAIKFPNVVAWIKRLQRLPYYSKVQNRGLKDIGDIFAHLSK